MTEICHIVSHIVIYLVYTPSSKSPPDEFTFRRSLDFYYPYVENDVMVYYLMIQKLQVDKCMIKGIAEIAQGALH